MRRVLAFVGTRADLFPMSPVLVQLAEDSIVDLHVATAVGFSDEGTETLLSEAGLHYGSFEHHAMGLRLDQPTAVGQTELGPKLSASFAALLEKIEPEALVILGDRWELLYVVPPAVLQGIRVIHLHGGEVTEGALDERVRHAVTKLSDQHCVSTVGAAKRVSQLGESANRIHQTGAPGLDRLGTPHPLSAEEFESLFEIPLVRPLLLVTYHPETATEIGQTGDRARQLYKETMAVAGTAILTFPGYDAGRDDILQVLDEIDTTAETGVIIKESLGVVYPRVLATADAVIGNSSSGLLEAASFSVPVVNVGDRQKGREHGANVINATNDHMSIRSSIERALSADFKELCLGVVNPYGDSNAAGRIKQVILASGSTPLAKAFIDICAGETES